MAGARSAARRARARRRRHARQDHDHEHAGVDPRARGPRAGLPDRRRAGELFGQRAARRAEVLRHRSRRIRHRVLRQARQVRALPPAHADPQQSRIRPRRHLREPRRDPEAVPSPGAHRAGVGPHSLERGDANLAADARDGRVDAARRIRARRRGATRSGRSTCEDGGDYSKFVVLEARQAAGHGAAGTWWARTTPRTRWPPSAPRATPACRVAQAIAALGRIQGREAPHGAARRSAAASRCTTTSRITRPRSPRPSTACAARSASSASSRCSSRARPPCAWACIATRWRRRWRRRHGVDVRAAGSRLGRGRRGGVARRQGPGRALARRARRGSRRRRHARATRCSS